MRVELSPNRLFVYVAVAIVAAAFVLARTPYSLIMPGRAVDLGRAIVVAGHRPPATRFYLTDVTFAENATPAGLLEGLAPGVEVVRTSRVVPHGVSLREYESVMRESMTESQAIGAVVAERAAHLPVPQPRTRILIVYFSPLSHARGILRAGDVVASVDGTPATSTVDVERLLAAVKPGTPVRVGIIRNGRPITLAVPTIAYGGQARLGVYLTAILQRPKLPISVAYHLPGIAGSSGGLMFALDIYRSLVRGRARYARIAGTGTISYGGAVGPIEGAPQKVIAARAAGARLFLVPRANYREIASTPGIRIVPVSTFRQALDAIGRRS